MPYRRILIVDNSPNILEILKLGVQRFSPASKVVLAKNGFAAIKQLQNNDTGRQFDLILTDYNMPGMNGLHMAKIVRQKWPGTRIILMSGSADSENLQKRAEILKLDGYVQKPFNMRRLKEILLSDTRQPCQIGPVTD